MQQKNTWGANAKHGGPVMSRTCGLREVADSPAREKDVRYLILTMEALPYGKSIDRWVHSPLPSLALEEIFSTSPWT